MVLTMARDRFPGLQTDERSMLPFNSTMMTVGCTQNVSLVAYSYGYERHKVIRNYKPVGAGAGRGASLFMVT